MRRWNWHKESKLETDQYSLFTSFAVCVPDNSGKEFVNKSVIHHVWDYHKKFPNENIIFFEDSINCHSFRIVSRFVHEDYFFPYADENNVEVNKFVDYLKEKFDHHSAYPEERYVLKVPSSLLKETYPEATDKLGNYYVKKTKNLPGNALLFISFVKLGPNSLNLAPTEADWLNPKKQMILRPRLWSSG